VDRSSQNSYLDTLEAAWEAHRAPRAADAPTVISTFAGAGGSSLGYSMAGYRELLAVEWDDNAVETFKLNFPDVPVYHGDIAALSVDQCLEMAGIAPGELDVLDGSPPCQGFSTAGKRILDDPRNQLFREFVRLLRGLRPRAFVMENVSGMVKGKMKLVFADILRELKASGYRVKAAKLNAMYFNVPQSRERMIFIGVREDVGREPTFPKAQNRPCDASLAIAGAAVDECGRPRGLLADRMKKVRPGSNLARTERSNAHFSYVRLPMTGPSMTLQKSVTFGGITIWHPQEERNLSIGELKRISSFPDDFVMPTDYEAAVARMGNSVPPLFMRAIAAHVQQTVLA
jgi:DNA (cytosine-5)-methyltransferase 1